MDNLDRNLGFLLHDVARLMRKRFEQNARDIAGARYRPERRERAGAR